MQMLAQRSGRSETLSGRIAYWGKPEHPVMQADARKYEELRKTREPIRTEEEKAGAALACRHPRVLGESIRWVSKPERNENIVINLSFKEGSKNKDFWFKAKLIFNFELKL